MPSTSLTHRPSSTISLVFQERSCSVISILLTGQGFTLLQLTVKNTFPALSMKLFLSPCACQRLYLSSSVFLYFFFKSLLTRRRRQEDGDPRFIHGCVPEPSQRLVQERPPTKAQRVTGGWRFLLQGQCPPRGLLRLPGFPAAAPRVRPKSEGASRPGG